jgi:hypothetical protein
VTLLRQQETNVELNEIKDLLSDRNLRTVSERSKLSYSTLRGIVKGRVETPSRSTIELLENYFKQTCPACEE